MIDIENKILLYQNRYHFSKIKEILTQLDVPYAIIKGEPLSVLAYGREGQRQSRDVDFLVSRDDLKKVEEIIKNMGYIQRPLSREERILMISHSHQTLPYYHIKYDLFIDINFDLFWGEYDGKRLDVKEFLSDAIETEIYGMKVKTLLPIKAMIQLILHNYKDMNSIYLLSTRKSIKYEMFKDVYYLLKNNLNSITLGLLYKLCLKYNIIPYAFYVLYYTRELFEDNILNQYIEVFRTPEGESLLNCYGLNAMERRQWKCDFLTRLESDNLYDQIKNDLTSRDYEKIAINKRIFMGA